MIISSSEFYTIEDVNAWRKVFDSQKSSDRALRTLLSLQVWRLGKIADCVRFMGHFFLVSDSNFNTSNVLLIELEIDSVSRIDQL